MCYGDLVTQNLQLHVAVLSDCALLTLAAEFEDIFEEPRQSIFLEDSIHKAHVAPVLSSAPTAGPSNDEDCPPPPPRKESLQQPAPQVKVR